MAEASGQKVKLIVAIVMLVIAAGLLAWQFGLFGGGGGGGGTSKPSNTPDPTPPANRATPDGSLGS